MAGKDVLIFSIGLILGGVGTFFGVKNHFKSQADREIEEVREYYRKELERAELEVIEAKTKDISDEFDQKMDEVKERKVVKRGERVNYNEIINKLNKECGENRPPVPIRDLKTVNLSQVVEEAKPMHATSEPFVISDEEYDELNGYDKQEISYFAYDEVFTDNMNRKMDNGLDLIGAKNITDFDENGEMYIRNDTFGIDFHVVLENANYFDQDFDE